MSKRKPLVRRHHKRNSKLFDPWSIVHLLTGVFLGWIMNPFIALIGMVLYEPLEVLVLSPLLARYGIDFGYESIQNSLSDIFFDSVGVAIGTYILAHVVSAPIHLF